MDPLAKIEAAIRELNEAGNAQAASDRDFEERRAEAARSGELGAEWRRVQARIDRGDTTLTAVFDGTDDSADAQELRAAANKHLADTMAELEHDAEIDPDAPNLRADAASVLGELQQQIAELNRKLEGLR